MLTEEEKLIRCVQWLNEQGIKATAGSVYAYAEQFGLYYAPATLTKKLKRLRSEGKLVCPCAAVGYRVKV